MLRSRLARLRPLRAAVPASLLLAATLAQAACGSDPAEPAGSEVAGSYAATTFTVTEGGATTDLLAQGASLQLVLAPDRTVAGRLLVPGGNESGADLDASMAGTWTVQGDVVRFQQTADTFVRDTPFAVAAGELRADVTFGGARLRVTLQRTP